MSFPAKPTTERPCGFEEPRQFRLLDLFALITLVALVMAIVSPYIRALKSENRARVLLVAGIQLTTIAATLVMVANRRRELLIQSGRRLGVGYCGTLRWRYWPATISAIGMVLLGLTQLLLAFLVIADPQDLRSSIFGPFFFQQMQLAWFTGHSLARYRWRAYPNTIEFFERGIALGATRFLPWAQVDLRPSQLFANRIVVLMHHAIGSVGGTTVTAQVTSSLRDRLLNEKGARPNGT